MLFESRRRRRHREAADRPFPEEWRTMLAARWPQWRVLSDDERSRLETMIKLFVIEKRWEAANQFEITEPMQVLIAAQACLLILALDDDHYRGVSTIIVHPTSVVLTGPRSTGSAGLVTNDPFRIDGQAHYGGPVIVAWDAVSYDARHPFRGLNVVYHEFAHKLDMLDGVIDGTPPLLDGPARERWVEVFTREFEAVRADTAGPLIREYGGENPGEFFAVVTELFFSKPIEMRAGKPELYESLVDFYRQDPAARFPQPTPPAPPLSVA
jgi:Mlc titration factor MtfA (ptsG expression regulator)